MYVSAKVHSTKAGRVVEGASLRHHRAPTHIVLRLFQRAALIAVGTNGLAGSRGVIRKESADKAVRDLILHLPAIGSVLRPGCDHRFLLNKAAQLLHTGAEAQEHGTVGIGFNVEVPGVALKLTLKIIMQLIS